VSLDEVPDYADVIHQPLDLGTLKDQIPKMSSPLEVLAGIDLIVRNCIVYNGEESEYSVAAKKMRTVFEKLWSQAGLPVSQSEWRKSKQNQVNGGPGVTETSTGVSSKRSASSAGKQSHGNRGSGSGGGSRGGGGSGAKQKTIIDSQEISPPGSGSRGVASAAGQGWKHTARTLMYRVVNFAPPEIAWFASPVSVEEVPDYLDVIANPMDLGTVAEKLKSDAYTTPEDMLADVSLIWDNAQKYNGTDHDVTKVAKKIRALFEKQWASAFRLDRVSSLSYASINPQPPPASVPSSAGDGRRASSGKQQPPCGGWRGANPSPVRQSRRGRDTTAASGAPPSPLPVVAKDDWVAAALSAIDSVLHHPSVRPFAEPLNAGMEMPPHYHQVVSRPIDFGTIRMRLCRGQYPEAAVVLSDVRLIFRNCRAYNAPGHDLWSKCEEAEAVFHQAWQAEGLPQM